MQDGTAGYWNPAALTGVQDYPSLNFMHASYFDNIGKYDYGSIAIPVSDNRRTLGLSILRFAVDDIPNTLYLVEPDGSINYGNITTFSSADYAVLLSFAQKIKDDDDFKMSFGGSDQWGNIVTGTELIRRKCGGEAFAFTCPLLTKSDGSKFGKSEKGNIWLDAEKTSPYSFYQFWLNTPDADAERFLKIFTFLSEEEIAQLVAEHTGKEHERILQKRLAKELTIFVHSKKDYDFAVKASSILFSNDTAQTLKELTESQLLQVMEGVPAIELKKSELDENNDLPSLLAYTKIFSSKGEARKMISGGGVFINKEKVTSVDESITIEKFLNDKYLLIQKGKKNYYLLKVD